MQQDKQTAKQDSLDRSTGQVNRTGQKDSKTGDEGKGPNTHIQCTMDSSAISSSKRL
jgi:hypothetical protein